MTAVHAAGTRNAWVYELVPSSSLSVLDISRSLKSKYLPLPVLDKVDDFLRRYNVPLFYMYLLGVAIGFVVPIVDAKSGSFLAILVVLFCLPMALASFSTLRYEVVRLLIHTYDFWFFTIVNVTTFAAGVALFGDLRGLRLVIDMFGFQNVVLIDAQLRGVHQIALVTPFALFVVLALLVCVVSNQVDDTKQTLLVHFKGNHRDYQISVADIMINGLVTLSILLLKIMYRVQRTWKAKVRESRSVLCAIYRVSIQLERCSQQQIIEVVPRSPVNISRTTSRLRRSIVQMQYVKSDQVFDSRRIMLPLKWLTDSTKPFPLPVLLLLYLVGVTGLALSVLSLTHIDSLQGHPAAHQDSLDTKNTQQDAAAWITTYGALVSSSVFTGVFFSLYQRDLLRATVTSFDFIFYSLQLTAAHLSICIIFGWDPRKCAGVLTSWLWVHWIMMVDALTPVMRTRLRFHVRMAAPVIAMFTIGQNLLVYLVLFHDSGPSDQVLWRWKVAGETEEIRAVPFFFGRLLAIVLWSMRLLFRVARASNCDAVMLRETVTYHKTISSNKRSRKRSTFVRVKHIPSRPSRNSE